MLAAALLTAGLGLTQVAVSAPVTPPAEPTPASSSEPSPPAGTAEASPESASVCGWPDKVQKRALEQATRLMPDSLRRILGRYERVLAAGARDARRASRDEARRHVQGPSQDSGAADRLAVSMARVTALMDAHASMRDVVREMGVASHLVADLSNPFRTAPRDTDAAAYEIRFETYVQENLPRLRIVFEGYGDPFLEAGDNVGFARQLAGRSRSYLDDVVGSFRLFDETGDSAHVDERSVPFGVASLSFSRTVTDTARVWLQSWRQAHGDLTGLPYPLDDPSDDESGMATKGSS
jgi:hypothetical protein